MRLGDVFQETDKGWAFQCRGCDRWLATGRDSTRKVGDCGKGCCDDMECPVCKHVTRVEWPD